MRLILLPVIIVAAIIAAVWFFFIAKPSEQTTVTDSAPTVLTKPSTELSVEDEKITQEAERYLDDITDKDNATLDVDSVNDFVTKDQTLSLGDTQEIEILSLEELISSGLSGSAPITIIKNQQEIVYKTPSDILLDAKGDRDQPIKYLEDGNLIESTVGELLTLYPLDFIENIPVVIDKELYVITTLDELKKDTSIDPAEPLKIIKKPYRLPTTSVGELLMGDSDIAIDDIFYVRNINANDQSGIWGIVQQSLLQNFAKGIAIKRGENYEKYQVMIPEDADEQLANKTSSFLGRLIYEKSQKSYVYNVEKGKMGRNPDLIYPGQEIVIIRFTPEELINIYKHFVSKAEN